MIAGGPAQVVKKREVLLDVFLGAGPMIEAEPNDPCLGSRNGVPQFVLARKVFFIDLPGRRPLVAPRREYAQDKGQAKKCSWKPDAASHVVAPLLGITQVCPRRAEVLNGLGSYNRFYIIMVREGKDPKSLPSCDRQFQSYRDRFPVTCREELFGSSLDTPLLAAR
jgi:hypothetical protein